MSKRRRSLPGKRSISLLGDEMNANAIDGALYYLLGNVATSEKLPRREVIDCNVHLFIPVQEESQEGVVLRGVGVRYNDVSHHSFVWNPELR